MKQKKYRQMAHAMRCHFLQKEKDGDRPLHRPKDWHTEQGNKEKKHKVKNWYKLGGTGSVIFEPYTLNS